MAKKVRRQRRTVRARKTQTSFFSKIKFTESYTSLILGAIVVLIVAILLISFVNVNRHKQISFISDISKIQEQIDQNANTSSTYTVRPGDDLWTISVNVYNNGYRWVEIAKLNNIANPGMIYSGDKLTLPAKSSNTQTEITTETSGTQDVLVNNNQITGNTYIVVVGDNLWDIAVRAYGDGFRWPDIAKANNLANPSLIHPGNYFIIPR